MGHRDHPVKIGAAQPDPMSGQNGKARTLLAKQRIVRGPAADVDDQTDLASNGQVMAGMGCGNGFKKKGHAGKSGRLVTAQKIGLGPGVAVVILRVKLHRTARQHPVKTAARLCLGAALHLGQKPGDDLGQGAPLAADQARLVKKRRAQHRFHRPHEAALLARDQGRRSRSPDLHFALVGGKEHGGGQGVRGRLDPQTADLAVVQHGGGGIRGAEIKGKDCGHVGLSRRLGAGR